MAPTLRAFVFFLHSEDGGDPADTTTGGHVSRKPGHPFGIESDHR